jgi:cell division protein ZapE
MPSTPISVTKLYEQSLVERGYKADAAQLKGIAALQRCQDEWASYKSQRSNALTKMLRYPPLAHAVCTCTVGWGAARASSWTVFSTQSLCSAKRVCTFHEFMREVHRQLHELKGVCRIP